ncbi:hypothetical protein BDZ89DRAFT_1121825 [Hymenopellis radicata]|nr:hypothetical protein BDZ89DRAFT_1121825 [Hymenopellis radicata]
MSAIMKTSRSGLEPPPSMYGLSPWPMSATTTPAETAVTVTPAEFVDCSTPSPNVDTSVPVIEEEAHHDSSSGTSASFFVDEPTAELRSFSNGYARTLHFFVSIARRSLYDQLDKLFQTRPELWPNEPWLFDVQDVFVAYYEDAGDMNSLWEEWTKDYERRLALLEGLPFAEQELALQKLSKLCMRTPQTINDILRLKARAHYAIKIITRTLLPTLTTNICKSILSQHKRLRGNRVKVQPVSLPPITQGVLELDSDQRGRDFILNLFPDEITAVEKLNLDMTKTIFELGQRAKAAIATRAQISRSTGLPPGAKREKKTYTRIPASEFRADDDGQH